MSARSRVSPILVTRLTQLAAGLAVAVTISMFMYRWYNTTTTSLFVANSTPFFVRVAVEHPGGRWIGEGSEPEWYTLAPATAVTVKAKFYKCKPTFYLFGATNDETLISWIYQGEAQGAYPAFHFPPEISRSTDRVFRVAKSIYNPQIEEGEEKGSVQDLQKEDAPFMLVEDEDAYPNHMVWQFLPPGEFDYSGSSAAEPEQVPKNLVAARMVRNSVVRQLKFAREWGSAELFPFYLGIEVVDDNSFINRGVLLKNCAAILPGGVPMPFQDGDILWSFAGRPVFGQSDLLSLLFDHATSLKHGIDVPISFEVFRGGQLRGGVTSYYFDKRFYDQKGVSPTEEGTLAYSVFDAIVFSCAEEVVSGGVTAFGELANGLEWVASTLGKREPKYAKVMSYEQRLWNMAQVEAMRRQWYPGTYFAGEVAGMFVNIPRTIVRSVGSRSMVRFASTRSGAMIFEIGEVAFMEAADGSPVRTVEQYMHVMKYNLPWTVFGGAVQGGWAKKSR